METSKQDIKAFNIKLSFKGRISYQSFYSILVLIFLIPFTYINGIYVIIPGFQNLFSESKEVISLHDIGYIWLPIISYVLISINTCFAVRVIKPLNEYNEQGLIFGLIVGLIFGLIVALIVGLSSVLIIGLIDGLIVGLIFGLIFGLIGGLIGEFKE